MKVTAPRIWALWAVPVVLVLVTYGRLPPARLYHVSNRGLWGGVSRSLVYLAFPVTLVAVAIVAVTYSSLVPRWRRATALASIVLCLTVALPGVIDQSDLDVKPITLLPVAGVVLAAVATLPSRWPGVVVARWTVAVAGVLGVLSLPWIAAEAGFDLPGRVFVTGKLVHEAGEPGLVPAVHLGDHHGLSSALIVVTVLSLWSAPRATATSPRRRVVQGYLALLLSYGLVNLVQDFWGEQVVDRGWAVRNIPDALQPGVSVIWAIIVAGAVAAYALSSAERQVGVKGSSSLAGDGQER